MTISIFAEYVVFGFLSGVDGKMFKRRGDEHSKSRRSTFELASSLDEFMLRAGQKIREKHFNIEVAECESLADVIRIGSIRTANARLSV